MRLISTYDDETHSQTEPFFGTAWDRIEAPKRERKKRAFIKSITLYSLYLYRSRTSKRNPAGVFERKTPSNAVAEQERRVAIRGQKKNKKKKEQVRKITGNKEVWRRDEVGEIDNKDKGARPEQTQCPPALKEDTEGTEYAESLTPPTPLIHRLSVYCVVNLLDTAIQSAIYMPRASVFCARPLIALHLY